MIGIDEVGRGSWAGPMVVAAAKRINPIRYLKLKDSKLLNKNQRQVFNDLILENYKVSLVWVSSIDIDKFGLTQMTMDAMNSAVRELDDGKSKIVIDGNIKYLRDSEYSDRCIYEIKADNKYDVVMAAAIVAKVARDKYMQQIDIEFPGYGFATNVGYGTKKHREALIKLLPTIHHRKSYKPIREI